MWWSGCRWGRFGAPDRIEVAPGEAARAEVGFVPGEEGGHLGSLEVLSDDPERPALTVELIGVALPGAVAWIGEGFTAPVAGCEAMAWMGLEAREALVVTGLEAGAAGIRWGERGEPPWALQAGESSGFGVVYAPAVPGPGVITLLARTDRAGLPEAALSMPVEAVAPEVEVTMHTQIDPPRSRFDMGGWPADGSITVAVDGATEGRWWYAEGDNAVVFEAEAIPAVGAAVEIRFGACG